MLGVHPNTLRNWANNGKINFIRSVGGYRLYDVNSFIRKGDTKRRICYCRVSSKKQKDDLERQVAFMRNRFPEYEIIEDIGSGLNFRRKGLIALLESADSGDVGEIVVAHKDRLSRFGFDLIRWFIERHGGKIMVLDESGLSPQQELVNDILSIIHVFSCRIHGLRKYSSKIKEDKDISRCPPETDFQGVVRGI
jgi:predicted site-specific integrase-resolvase